MKTIKSILCFLILTSVISTAPAFALDVSLLAGMSQPTNENVESRGWIKLEMPVYKDLALGAGLETGSRNYIIELYSYDLYSLYAKQSISLTDRLSTYLSIGYYHPKVSDKGLTTKEAFMYYAASELPAPMTFYDRVDVDVKGNFGGEIGLNYKISNHFDFGVLYRLLKLTENIRGYGYFDAACTIPRNAWMDRDTDYSAFGIYFRYNF